MLNTLIKILLIYIKKKIDKTRKSFEFQLLYFFLDYYSHQSLITFFGI